MKLLLQELHCGPNRSSEMENMVLFHPIAFTGFFVCARNEGRPSRKSNATA
jgi:hypothetical protein